MSEPKKRRNRKDVGVGKTSGQERHRSRKGVGAEKVSESERHRNRKDAEESETRGAPGPPLRRAIAFLKPARLRYRACRSTKPGTCACAWRIRGNACAHLHAGAHLGHNVSALHETLSRFFLRIASQRSRRRRAGSGQDRRLNPGKRLASSAMHTAGAGATKAENRRRKRNTTDRRIDLPRSHTATLSERAARSRKVPTTLRRVRAASAHVGRCPLDERDTP